MKIVTTVGEIRWEGDPNLKEDAVLVLKEAQKVGEAAAAAINDHLQQGTSRVQMSQGWCALPLVANGAPGMTTWLHIRRIISKIDELIPTASKRDDLSPEFASMLDSTREHFDELAALVPYDRIVVGVASSFAPGLSALDAAAAKWRDINILRDPNSFSASVKQIGDALTEVARAAPPFHALAAFGSMAGSAPKLWNSYRTEMASTVAAHKKSADEQLAEAKKTKKDIDETLDAARGVLEQIRTASGAAALEVYRGSFTTSIKDHAYARKVWLAVAAGASVVALLVAARLAGVTALDDVVHITPHTAPASWPELLYVVAPRVVLMGVPTLVAIWAARLSTMHRKAAIADQHRLDALTTYNRLLSSAGTPRGQELVLQAVTECVFGKSIPLEDGPSPSDALRDIARSASAAARG